MSCLPAIDDGQVCLELDLTTFGYQHVEYDFLGVFEIPTCRRSVEGS